jgi:DNA-binding MarR family transcriptional regulator
MWRMAERPTEPVAPPAARSEDELRTSIVDDLLTLSHVLLRHIALAAARQGLTGQQAIVLRALGEPRSMRSVAEDLSCDPSNVTGLIDRIERLGLVARSADPDDRRVRRLELTASGQTVRRRLDRDIGALKAPFVDLSFEELATLADLLRRVTPDASSADVGGDGDGATLR